MSRRAYANWLLAKEVPYALTIVLAVLAWCLVQNLNSVEDSPSVEYVKTVKPEDNGTFDVTFDVTNISLKHFFHGVSFYITNQDGTFSKLDQIAIPPAKEVANENPNPGEISAPNADNLLRTCRYFVAQFMPAASWRFTAVLSATSRPDPQLLVDFSSIIGMPRVKVEPVGIRLIKSGLETTLVRYKVQILFWSAVILLVIVIVYIWRVHEQSK